MNKAKTNKKITIIALILLFGITLPQIASASLVIDFAQHAGMAILQALGKILTRFFSWLIDLAADFFESMLTAGFKGQQDIAKIGWNVTRDFANMLFILFMVVIAFATILRFEKYGVKELLPKLILIALLINFSMVICYVIIDFTNIIADFFIKDAKNGLPGTQLTISAILSDSFMLPDLYIPMVCERYLTARDDCYNGDLITEIAINNCVNNYETLLNQCYANDEKQETEEDNFLDVIVATLGSAAVLLIAAFVLFAGAILLVVRLVAIWFLVMIAPLAFICYILPALRRNWESWWSQFIRWCIFAPAYSFFIWLACKISLEQKLANIAALSQNISLRSPSAINAFFSDSGKLLQFVFICGILIGGMLAANQLGIKGAGTAMAIGKRWANTAKGWAKKTAMKGAKTAYEKTTQTPRDIAKYGAQGARKMFGAGLKNIPGFRRIGSTMEAKGKIGQEKVVAGSPAIKSMAETVKKLDSKEKARRLLSSAVTAPTKRLLTHSMVENNDFEKIQDKKTRNDAVRTAAGYLRSEGDVKGAEELQKKYMDSFEGMGEINTNLKELNEKKELDKLSPKALRDPRVLAELCKITKGNLAIFEQLRSKSKEHADAIDNGLKEATDPHNAGAMTTAGIIPTSNEISLAYAAQTGDTSRLSQVQEMLLGRDGGANGLKRTDHLTPEMLRHFKPTQFKKLISSFEEEGNNSAAIDAIRIVKSNPNHPAYNIVRNDKYLDNLWPTGGNRGGGQTGGGATPGPTTGGGTTPPPGPPPGPGPTTGGGATPGPTTGGGTTPTPSGLGPITPFEDPKSKFDKTITLRKNGDLQKEGDKSIKASGPEMQQVRRDRESNMLTIERMDDLVRNGGKLEVGIKEKGKIEEGWTVLGSAGENLVGEKMVRLNKKNLLGKATEKTVPFSDIKRWRELNE